MSRNFELLSQLECKLGGTDNKTRAAVHRPVIKAAAANDAGNTSSQEMLRLVQAIFLSSNGSGPRQVVFCGVDDENGSSSVCASAGRALAANTSRAVCVVDANLRSPHLSDLFQVDTATPFISKPKSVRDRCVAIADNLWLAGPSVLTDDRGAISSAGQLKQLLADLSSAFEFVLIDAPGTSISGDAATLGQAVDAAILVIEADNTRRLSARRAKETLDAAGVRLMGTVLHNRSFPIPKGLYNKL